MLNDTEILRKPDLVKYHNSGQIQKWHVLASLNISIVYAFRKNVFRFGLSLW